jgi:hypothetical protein
MTNAQRFIAQYIADDGGGRLTLIPDLPINEGCKLSSPWNDNAVVYFVQPAIEFLKKDESLLPIFKERFDTHMKETEIVVGLHGRRCGFTDNQSHDNVLAFIVGGKYFKSEYLAKVYSYLKVHGFNYNIKRDGWRLECQIQGGDICIADMAMEYTPALWHTLWLGIGLSVTTKWNLADIRLTFLKDHAHKLPRIHRTIVEIGMFIHELRRGPRKERCLQFDFPAEHPFVQEILNGT